MSTLLIICLSVVTAAAVALVISLMRTLKQLGRTARALEVLIENVNAEVMKADEIISRVNDITGKISKIFGVPALKILGIAGGILKGWSFIRGFKRDSAGKGGTENG